MRRASLLSAPLIFLLLLFTLPHGTATAQCDSVTAVKQSPTGCTNWLIQNRNASRTTINRIRFELLTAGMSWAGTAMADSWTVLQLAPHILELDAGAGGLRTGVDMFVNLVCLARICAVDGDYQVKWTTFDGGSQICTGTETLSCKALERTDSLSARIHPVDWRCHRLTLHNFNSLTFPIDELSLTPLTANVSVNITPPAGWTVRSGGGSTMLDADPDPLDPGDSLSGIQLCFTQTPPGIDTVDFLWEARNNGVGLSYDTLRIRLGREPRCDSMVVTQYGASTDSSCKEISLFNLHEPQSPITAFTLQIVTPGAVFVTGAGGPWNLTQETSKFLRFASPSGGIVNGDSATGFHFCILNASGSTDVLLRLTSYDGSRELCSTEEYTTVPTVDGLCDRFTARRTGGSSYVLGFLNRRQPSLPLDGFTFTVLNSGPTVVTAAPATGWATLSQDATSASYRTGSPVFPGGSIDGFAVRFDPGQQDTVRLELCTLAGGTDACCDTIVLPITTDEIRCDSLLLAEAPVPDACNWKAGFANTHLPASATTRFSLQAITPGTRFTATGIPPGWMLLDDGSTGTLTLQRDTATAEGLLFDLAVQSPSATALFEWCTADANGPICCGIDSVYCPPEAHCGDMEVRDGAGALEREVRLRNAISPAVAVDAIRLAVTTQGAGFANVQAPTSWTVTLNAARDSALVEPEAAIATDSSSAWFTVTLTEAPGCDSIRWSWTAITGGADLCDATLPPVACAVTSCDTVLFTSDAARPCCFDISVRNAGSSDIDGLTLAVLTPGASAFGSTLESPMDWTLGGDTLFMQWNASSAPIAPGQTLSGFTVCFSNGWIGNDDFHVRWQTYTGRTLRCEDTVTIACDRTLAVEHLDAPLPAAVSLQQNYPNPFRASTSVVFALPREQDVALRVYDMHGRRVSSICEGRYPAGSYRVHLDAGELPAGTYLMRLTAGGEVRTRLMQLLR
jgi:hypothetical protein